MRMKMENRRRRRRCRRQGLNFLGQRRRLHPAPGRSFPERPGEPRAPGASPVPGGTLRGAPTPPRVRLLQALPGSGEAEAAAEPAPCRRTTSP